MYLTAHHVQDFSSAMHTVSNQYRNAKLFHVNVTSAGIASALQ